MHRAIGAALAAFAIALLSGHALLPLLRRLKFGQQVHDLVPEGHKKKQGTPTMGGVMICFAVVAAVLLLHTGTWSPRSDMTLAAILLCFFYLCIGATDDLMKIRRKNNKGLTARQKLIPQILIAVPFALYCYFHPEIGSSILIPFWGREISLGWLYIPFAAFVVVATANSANLLDGLDGLLGTVSLLDMMTFGVIVLLLAQGGASLNNLSIFAFAVAGATLGYLRYNIHPAMLLMGDTGSMFIGGAVAAVALMSKTPLLIVIACFMMVASSLSTTIQRFYYRRTGGKRIFLSSPLHHHFELKGMSEARIVSMYGIVTLVLCLISLLTM